jgi:hypothetical protein
MPPLDVFVYGLPGMAAATGSSANAMRGPSMSPDITNSALMTRRTGGPIRRIETGIVFMCSSPQSFQIGTSGEQLESF